MQPRDEITANGGDLVHPYAFHRRRELIMLPRGDLVDDRIEHDAGPFEIRLRHRKFASAPQFAEEAELDRVEDAPARERIHALKRFRRRERLEVGARSKMSVK